MVLQRILCVFALLVAFAGKDVLANPRGDPGVAPYTKTDIYNKMDEYSYHSMKTHNGGAGWQKMFKTGDIPKMNLTHKRFVPKELTTIPDNYKLGNAQAVADAKEKYLAQAEQYYKRGAAREKAMTGAFGNRKDFLGSWAIDKVLAPKMNAAMKAKGFPENGKHGKAYNAATTGKEAPKSLGPKPLALGRKGAIH